MLRHTRRGTPTAGRGTGFCGALTRASAAVTAARAVVPNSIDDGAGAFEHEAQKLAEAALVICRRALSRSSCMPSSSQS